MGRFFRFSRAPVTGTLLAVIFAMFGVEWYFHALDNNAMLYRLGAISRDLITDHQYWRAVTGMFLHGSPLHVLTNTFSLWQLGTLYEAMFGSKRFAFIYFTTGIIASFASAMFMPAHQISVGASGAVLGIVGAFIFSILRSPQFRHERWARSIIQQLLFWVGVNLLLPFVIPNLDNTAHIAGLTSGLLLGFIPHRVPPPPPSDAVIDV